MVQHLNFLNLPFPFAKGTGEYSDPTCIYLLHIIECFLFKTFTNMRINMQGMHVGYLV